MIETKPDTCGVVVIPPVVFAFCLAAGIGATLAYGRGFGFLPWQMRWPAGALVLVYGGLVAIWGLDLFRRAKTPFQHHKPAGALVTSGAYQRTRNPMYVGLVCALMGIGLVFGAVPILLSAVVMFAYLNWYVIPREEAYLTRSFGDAYRRYCAKVRRWI